MFKKSSYFQHSKTFDIIFIKGCNYHLLCQYWDMFICWMRNFLHSWTYGPQSGELKSGQIPDYCKDYGFRNTFHNATSHRVMHIHTVSASMQPWGSINLLDFQAAHCGLFRQKVSENYRILGRFFAENDQSAPKICHLGLYSRWGCIDADTVDSV